MGDPLDVCMCGDFRKEHRDGTGACLLGELCFPSRCQQFRLAQTGAQYAAEQPKHAAYLCELLSLKDTSHAD